ncbi:MAG: hypothetical protein ACRYGG_14820 [Janthinobacterium lividum]
MEKLPMFFSVTLKPNPRSLAEYRTGFEKMIELFNLKFFSLEDKEEVFNLDKLFTQLVIERNDEIYISTMSGTPKLFPIPNTTELNYKLIDNLKANKPLAQYTPDDDATFLLSSDQFYKLLDFSTNFYKNKNADITILCNDLFQNSSYCKIETVDKYKDFLDDMF